MNVLVPISGSAGLPQRGAASGALTWRDGAIVKAVVAARSQDGVTDLTVGRETVRARGGDTLKPGQTLTLRVSVNRNLVLLRQVPAPAAEAIRSAIRQALPMQGGQPALLANLELLARPGGTTPVADIARTLLGALPVAGELRDGPALREAILRSGLFLDSRLAAAGASAAIRGDWKVALLKAAGAIAALRTTAPAGQTTRAVNPSGPAPAPPLRGSALTPQSRATPSVTGLGDHAIAEELSTQMSGALSRLTLTQLASIPADGTEPECWLFELPVRGEDGRADVFGFRFERERRRPGEPAAGWTARLAFDFPATGPVQATVTLRGNNVTTVFHAAQPGTAARYRTSLDGLAARFARQGLGVTALCCHCGEPAGSDGDAPPGRLLETSA